MWEDEFDSRATHNIRSKRQWRLIGRTANTRLLRKRFDVR
jgi:hypothetical protein